MGQTDVASLKMPHTALEASTALESLDYAEVSAIMRGGQDPWVRSAFRHGGQIRSLGMHAVEVGEWHWPVLFFEVSVRERRGKGMVTRRVSIAKPMRKNADAQAEAPWLVRSFLALKDLGVYMGDRSMGASVVNGDVA